MSGNEKLAKEYIYYFDIVVVHFTQEFNINNGKTFPFIIDDNIYEIIFSLGKFGQTPENYRLCCYLASCMCRIIGNVDENINIQKMFDRICFLFSDVEKTTETQISRELKYLIPIFKEKIMEKNNILQAIKSYINHDFDHIIQSTTIISLLSNIKYISNELKQLLIEKINEIFEDNNYEDEYKSTIVDTIINSLYNECLEYEIKHNECEQSNNNGNENNNEIDKEEFEKTNYIKNPIKLIKYLSPKQKMFERINTICSTENSITNSRINSAKKKSFCDEEDLLIQNNLFEKELLEKRNIKFYQKYKNCLNGIKREENKHYSNKVFNKDLINLIMKSKNDLEIDKLKYDYNDKIGIIEANNQIILNKHNDNQSRNKHKSINSVADKMNTAYYNNEMGRLDSTNKYNIEDFIQL
jgi:hypothetical protein